MVNTSMELIAVSDTGRTSNVIERGVAGGIWHRVVFQGRVANQAEALLRNDVSGKRTPPVRRGIVRRGVVDDWAPGEVAVPLRFGWNTQVKGVCPPSPKTFVVDHEEGFVSDYRTTQHAPELISLEWIDGRGKEAPRVQCVITEELKHRAMKAVGSGLQRQVNCSRIFSILSRKAVRLYP